MSAPQDSQDGLYLYVNYHGQKSFDNFNPAKFDDESTRVFRNDLLEMKFHLPKTVNTWLYYPGCMVGFWPDVERATHAPLYKLLEGKIEAAKEDRTEMKELSINRIMLKERTSRTWSVLASTSRNHRNLKRRRTDGRTPSPSPSVASDYSDARSAAEEMSSRHNSPESTEMRGRKRSWSTSRREEDFRPRSRMRIAFPFKRHVTPPRPPPIPLSQQRPPFFPPPMPQPSTAAQPPASQHQQLPSSMQQGPSQHPRQQPLSSQQQQQPTSLFDRVSSSYNPPPRATPTEPAAARAALRTFGERMGRDALPAQQSVQRIRTAISQLRTHIRTNVAKEKSLVDDLDKLGATYGAPPLRLVDEAAETAKASQLVELQGRLAHAEETARARSSYKPRLDEALDKLKEAETARSQLHSMFTAIQQAEADTNRRLEKALDELKAQSHLRAEAEGLVASMRRSGKEKDDLARRYERAQDELALFNQNAISLQNELSQLKYKLERTEKALREEKDRRKDYQERLSVAEKSGSSFKQRYEESVQNVTVLTRTREREANEARAAQQRYEDTIKVNSDKARTQQLVITHAESAMHTARTSEEAMRRRLEEVERTLENERRLRQEAEDAIADIRRECREPFVVPSLLDAFIELAHLTTAATTGSQGKGKEREGGIDITSAPEGSAAHTYKPLTPPSNASHTPDVDMRSPGRIKQEPHS